MNTYSYTFRHKNGWGSCRSEDFPHPTHCHECGVALPERSEDYSGASGYGCGPGAHVGNTRDGQHIEQSPAICYACCHAHDLAQLRDRSRPMGVYVSCDGKTVSNWPGGILGRVVAEWRSRSGFADVTHYRVIDAHGARWYGKGPGRGMYLRLRPAA